MEMYMKYDSKQIKCEIDSLKNTKESAFNQYMKICGAIEFLESMHSVADIHEKEQASRLESENQQNLYRNDQIETPAGMAVMD